MMIPIGKIIDSDKDLKSFNIQNLNQNNNYHVITCILFLMIYLKSVERKN